MTGRRHLAWAWAAVAVITVLVGVISGAGVPFAKPIPKVVTGRDLKGHSWDFVYSSLSGQIDFWPDGTYEHCFVGCGWCWYGTWSVNDGELSLTETTNGQTWRLYRSKLSPVVGWWKSRGAVGDMFCQPLSFTGPTESPVKISLSKPSPLPRTKHRLRSVEF